MQMNLAVINSKTHEVKVFNGKTEIGKATFSTYLEPEQVEAMRVDPKGFLSQFDVVEAELPASA